MKHRLILVSVLMVLVLASGLSLGLSLDYSRPFEGNHTLLVRVHENSTGLGDVPVTLTMGGFSITKRTNKEGYVTFDAYFKGSFEISVKHGKRAYYVIDSPIKHNPRNLENAPTPSKQSEQNWEAGSMGNLATQGSGNNQGKSEKQRGKITSITSLTVGILENSWPVLWIITIILILAVIIIIAPPKLYLLRRKEKSELIQMKEQIKENSVYRWFS